MPGFPGCTLYAAAKAFVIKFSESRSAGLFGKNIYVTAVCPGFTHTEFHDVGGLQNVVDHFPSYLWMDAATVARQGIDAVNNGDVLCVIGSRNKVMIGLLKCLPHRASFALVRKLAPPVETDK
jgi:short-subunit dehydrogenase